MIKKRRILFVNPPTPQKGVVIIRDIDRSGRTSMEKTIWPQTSLAYLAAVMKENGFEVEIIDCIAEKIYWNAFEIIIQQKRPDYLLINVISSTINNDMKAAEIGKKIGTTTIVVGPHVTVLPEQTLKDFSFIDFAILGEAEETIKDLINSIEQKIAIDDFAKIKGICFRNKDRIISTGKRPLINDLNSLPIPLHELLPINKYNLPFIGRRYTFVTTSRGCPYRCIFCRSPINWDRQVRYRSAESIIKELEYLKKINVKNFLIHSDIFTVNKDIVINICKEIINKNWKFRWICNSRVDTVDREMLVWMKRAGCVMISYGIESGSQKVLDMANKGITIEQTKEAVKLTQKAGIKVWGYFIIGLPGETKETVEETIQLSKNLHLDLVNFAVATPYPGTEFYEMSLKNNWLVAKRWEDFDQNCSTAVSYLGMSNGEIKKATSRAYKKWYFRPVAIWKLLSGIRTFSDIKTLFSVAFTFVRWMFFRVDFKGGKKN